MKHYKTVLSIAGSDSIGGAGIQADIKTCCSIGVYAMTVVTAVTAQNSTGVKGIQVTSPDILRLQLDTVLSDVMPDAVKIGMLPNATCAEIVADAIDKYRQTNIVIDPVMLSSSGYTLSGEDVKSILLNRLIGKAAVLTPNTTEASVLTQLPINNINDAISAGEHLASHYRSTAILIKGGDCAENGSVTDILVAGSKTCQYTHPHISTRNTHGTGCSLSSAIAAYITLGQTVSEAIESAIKWEQKAIKAGAEFEFGSPHGHGPLNHMLIN